MHDERKLIFVTSIILSESSIGFIITPPPIPKTAPIEEANKLTIKNSNTSIMLI